MRKLFQRSVLGPLVLLLQMWAGTNARAQEVPADNVATNRPPNIIVVLADDMGYADIGPFGALDYETPNIDKMASEGRLLTDFYVSHALCSTSRAALMTGCYNVRVGFTRALLPTHTTGLSPEETTVAEVLKQRGYATAIYGKWHLGIHPKFLPTNQGFDDYYGLPTSNNFGPDNFQARNLPPAQRASSWPYLPLFEDTELVEPNITSEIHAQLTTRFTERSIQFIRAHNDEPFFLFVSHVMPHVPLHVSEKFAGRSKQGLYGDVVMELDWSLGQILDTLRDEGLAENTLVIYTSDNGPWLSFGKHAGRTGVFREGKWTTFEGGVRMPTIVWWPGRIPAGTSTSIPAMTIDLLPTFAALADAPLPERQIDGKSIWPILSGEPNARSPHDAYYFYNGNRLEAVLSGKWKLHFPHPYRTLGGRTGRDDGSPVQYQNASLNQSLFDLDTDPGETQDVSRTNPEVVARLTALADEIRADLGDFDRQGPGIRPMADLEPGDARYIVVDGHYELRR